MAFPLTIKSGFDLDEAIPMAELSQRAYRIFEAEAEREPGDVYSVLYRDEWRYLHSLGNLAKGVRCFIARRGNTAQYAIVFRGSTLTSSGIEWTNLSYNNDDVMIPYEHPAGLYNAGETEARVHRGMWQPFAVLRPEIELFFSVLTGHAMKPEVLVDLVEAAPQVRAERIAAIAAAVNAVHGSSPAQRLTRQLTSAIGQIEAGEKAVTDFSLDQLIAASSKLESVLADLAASGGEGNQAKRTGLELYITGHSLGGVLAQYCAVTLQQLWTADKSFPPFELKVYAIGSPKIGNRAFVELYNRLLKDRSYRVENQLDPTIRLPQASAPFPYNLQLLIPNVEFVRDGDNYYAPYAAAGEVYNLFNVGYQNLELNFGGPIRFTVPIPFPHGPDGYKEMLMRAQEFQQRFWKPAQNIVRTVFQEQTEQMGRLQLQLEELRAAVEVVAAHHENGQGAGDDNAKVMAELKAMRKQMKDLKQAIEALNVAPENPPDSAQAEA